MGWPQNIKAKIDIIENGKSFTVIVGDTGTTFSMKDGATQQKISKKIEESNNSLNQLNPGDIHMKMAENKGIRILLKCTWDILQDRPCVRSQTKS